MRLKWQPWHYSRPDTVTDQLSGFQLFHYDEVASTNDAAKDYAARGETQPAVFIADRQTGGRGRSGNSWESPVGNLYMSCVLFRDMPAKNAGQYSFLTAVALFDTIQPYLANHQTLALKWPNDLLLDDKKLAGILLESNVLDGRLNWLVIGVGINLAYAPDYAAKLGDQIDRLKFAETLLSNVSSLSQVIERSGFKSIRKRWLGHAARLGKNIQVRLPRETLSGTFETIDEDGCLILKQDKKRQRIASGDVFFE